LLADGNVGTVFNQVVHSVSAIGAVNGRFGSGGFKNNLWVMFAHASGSSGLCTLGGAFGIGLFALEV